MAEKTVVNPTFRLDVDGSLFKEKKTNLNVLDNFVFSNLYTRLCIVKGDIVTFPDLGLKQHLFLFAFVDESEIASNVSKFEDDIENQMRMGCTIDYKIDKNDRSVDLTIAIDGLKYPISFKYLYLQNSIKIIHYEFKDDD